MQVWKADRDYKSDVKERKKNRLRGSIEFGLVFIEPKKPTGWRKTSNNLSEILKLRWKARPEL